MAAPQNNPAAKCYPIAAAALGLMLTGALMPTPLYELYQRVWRLTPGEVSAVFAAYAGSLIPALVFLGGISDQIGRRRALGIALVLMAAGSLIFAFAAGLSWLFVARIVQGFAMGIGLPTATAAIREWMDERARSQAGALTIVSVGAGSILGALLAGTLGQYGPLPLMLPYLVHVVLLTGVGLAVAFVPSCPHLAPAAHSALPTIPRAIWRPFLIVSVTSFIGWGALAIFFSLVPSFLARTLNDQNLLLGTLVVCGAQAGSIAASLLGRRVPNRVAIIAGMLALGAGVWLLLVAIPFHAYALVALATLVVGAGQGLAYLAALDTIGEIAPPEHRAEVTAGFFVANYLGFSIPALAVGIAANWFGFYASMVGGAVALGVIAVSVIVLTTERNLRVASG